MAGISAALVLAGVALVIFLARITPPPSFWNAEPHPPTLLSVRDRDGNLLATVRRGDGPHLPLTLAEFDSTLIRATLAAEDQRFFHHPGVDVLAALRAAGQNLRAGRRVSGGSTLTQQLVEVLERDTATSGTRNGNSLREKARQTWWALVLDAHLSKAEILESYLNRAPYGPTERGAAAAARLYFGHGPKRLTLEQAALLAAIPQSPVRHDPRRDPAAARRARNRVLARMGLSPEDLAAAQARSLGLAAAPVSLAASSAPHWIDRLSRAMPDVAEARLPLDPQLQEIASDALRGALSQLGARGADAGAVVVMHNPSGEVRAWVGSTDWHHPGHGQFDAAFALRQPGSALKPFTYALGFREGWRPSSILIDLPVNHPGLDGSFRPRNYAGSYRGPVRARAALASSWNAPAVDLLSHLGPEKLMSLLRACGITSLRRPAEEYGLGLTLGVAEVSLMELTGAYSVLARGGLRLPRIEILEARDAAGRTLRGPGSLEPEDAGPERVLDAASVFFVTSILADPIARAPAFGLSGEFAFPFPVAIKTGTSSDWRDNWAFGYTPLWTAGAWVGAAGGAPMDRVSGTRGAILAIRHVLLALHPESRFESGDEPFAPPFGVEERAICALSGMRPSPACPERLEDWFRATDPEGPVCSWHRAVRIDEASGQLARACTPAERVRRVIYSIPADDASAAEAKTAMLELWARDQGWRHPPREMGVCVCGREDCAALDGTQSATNATTPAIDGVHPASAPAACQILRPAEGNTYAIDPSLPAAQQEIPLEGSAGADRIRWKVNGEEIGETAPGARLFWRLRPGEFRIRAERIGGAAPAADEVRIRVEAGGE